MPLGEVGIDRVDCYLPLQELRERLDAKYTLEPTDHRTGGPRATTGSSRNQRLARLHYPDESQFLRELQPRAPHRHRPALSVPRPGRHGRPARTRSAIGGPDALDAALDRAMLLKPKGHDFMLDRDHTGPALTPAHERYRRLCLPGAGRGVTASGFRRRRGSVPSVVRSIASMLRTRSISFLNPYVRGSKSGRGWRAGCR